MKNLCNEVYSLLPIEEKKEILENLAKKYNMELLRFETFSKYSKSTFTAVFKYKESEFVFVPGDTVTLGYEGLPKNLSDETLKVAKENEVNFVILKERSPSCGSTHIYDGSFSGNVIPGQGITAKRLTEEKIKVFSEENLEEIEKYLVELDKN